jgi:hypothetical protein
MGSMGEVGGFPHTHVPKEDPEHTEYAEPEQPGQSPMTISSPSGQGPKNDPSNETDPSGAPLPVAASRPQAARDATTKKMLRTLIDPSSLR